MFENFEGIWNQVGNVNVQVPIGYVLMGAAAIYATWWSIKKALMVAKFLVLGVFTRFSLAMLGSGALFLGGLTGMGNSIGNFSSNNQPTAKEQQSVAYIDKDTIKAIVKNSGTTEESKRLAFKYAEKQDEKTGDKVVYVTTKVDGNDQPVVESEKSNVLPWTVLTGSFGMILVGIVWMLRRWNE